MAIEIIPKEEEKIPIWQNIIFYLFIVLVVLCLIGYFVLSRLTQEAESKLKEIEGQLEEDSGPMLDLEKELLGLQKRINDFNFLITKHERGTNFFNFLEATCHPKVFFSDTILNLAENTATLFGKADDFEAVGQQILIFKEENRKKNYLKDIQLSDIQKGKEGKIEFQLTIAINPKLLEGCSDLTFRGECSENKPKYCDLGFLIDRCSVCGCPLGQECQPDETCR